MPIRISGIPYSFEKTATIHSQDLDDLLAWNANPQKDTLRPILGRIMSRLNLVSELIKGASSGTVSESSVSTAKDILPDLANIAPLRDAATQALQHIRQADWPPADKAILERMAHAVERAQIQPRHVEVVNRLASGEVPASRFHEADLEKMKRFLAGSIYSTKNDSEKTVKVLREVLQNATDASLKRKRAKGETPTVKIWVSRHGEGDDRLLDMMVVDDGIGMDWKTLSQKFFVYFASGKEDDKAAAGGFGIAKGLIQQTPAHGWSLESGDIHSSSFGRNMYFADREEYAPPAPQIEVSPNGTALTLYGLPTAHDYSLQDVCRKYSIGQIEIYYNGHAVEPVLNLKEMVPMDDSLDHLADVVSETALEKDVANSVIKENKDDVEGLLGNLTWEFGGTKTDIQFSISRDKTNTGRLYVLLNGQYQFDEYRWIPKASIVCIITTNARPNSDEYPMDPGRDGIRAPYKEAVQRAVDSVKRILEEIGNNTVFKKGVQIKLFNRDKTPIIPSMIRGRRQKEHTKQDLSPETLYEQEENPQQYEDDMYERGLPRELSAPPEEMERVVEQLQSEQQLDPLQKAMMEVAVKAKEKSTAPADKVEHLDKAIRSVSTPCSVLIQNGFTRDAVVDQNPELLASLMVVWHSAIHRILEKAGSLVLEDRPVIPGAIFSSEVAALSNPPDDQNPYHILAVNPISVLAIVDPKMLGKLSDIGEKAPEDEGTPADQNTASRLASMIHHLAVHEATHYIWPDMYGSDRFHKNVTRLENMMHFSFNDVRKDVAQYLPQIRKELKQLAKAINKDIVQEKKGKTSSPSKQREPAEERPGLIPKDLTEENRHAIWLANYFPKSDVNVAMPGTNDIIPVNEVTESKKLSWEGLERKFNLRPARGMTAYRAVHGHDHLLGKMIEDMRKSDYWIKAWEIADKLQEKGFGLPDAEETVIEIEQRYHARNEKARQKRQAWMAKNFKFLQG